MGKQSQNPWWQQSILIAFTVILNACSIDANIHDLNSKKNSLDQITPSPADPGSNNPIVTKRFGKPFFNGHVEAVSVDSLGRSVYVGGFKAFTFNKSNYIGRLMRLNADGSKDDTFNVGIGYDAYASKIGVSADNGIILSGYFWNFNQTSVRAVSKVTATGSLDTTYLPLMNNTVHDFVITPSDQIVAVGDLTYWSTAANPQNGIVRINSNGTRDTTLTIGTSFSPTQSAIAIALQSDGKFIVGGSFNSFNGNSSPKIVRLNTNGTYDNTFAVGAGFNGTVYDVHVMTDGSILAVGDFTSYKGTSGVNRIAKISSTGTLDTAFTTAVGTGFATYPRLVKEIAGVGIIVGGDFSLYQGGTVGKIICLNSNGTTCAGVNFGTGAYDANLPAVADVVKLDANTMVVAGTFTKFNSVAAGNIVALNLDGSRSNRYDGFKGVDAAVTAIHVQSDGKLLVAGELLLYDPIYLPKGLVRFNDDETLDEDFFENTKTLPVSGSFLSVLTDSADRLWLAGNLPAGGGNTVNHVARLTSDGTLDSTCASSLGTGFDNLTREMFMQSDGKIVVTGEFTALNGSTIRKSARIATNCAYDNTYSTGTGITGVLQNSHVLSTGKIMHVGSITAYSGTTVNKVVRVNSDGSIDGTYPNNSTKTGISILGSAVDSSDRLYLLTSSGTYNGTSVSAGLIRILPNGTVDSTFSTASVLNYGANVVKVFGNKIYVGGDHGAFISATPKYLAILNMDGTEDTTTPRPEAILPVQDVYIGADGRVEYAYKINELSY